MIVKSEAVTSNVKKPDFSNYMQHADNQSGNVIYFFACVIRVITKITV